MTGTAKWIDYWNVTFGTPIKQGEIEAVEDMLRRINPIPIRREVVESIISLDESGRRKEYGSKAGQLREEIVRNRRGKAGSDPKSLAWDVEIDRIKNMLQEEEDPKKRWDIICDEPKLPAMSDVLELYCRTEIPGGYEKGYVGTWDEEGLS